MNYNHTQIGYLMITILTAVALFYGGFLIQSDFDPVLLIVTILILFLLGSFVYQNSLRLSSNHIASYVTQEKEQVPLKGLIISDPIYSRQFMGQARLLLC